MTVRVLAILVLLVTTASADTSIKGTVIFEGDPPDQGKQDRSADPRCAPDRPDEAVVVTRGKVRDVLVRIKNGTTGTHPVPATPVVIDQRGCTYTPRVVGLIAGQKLLVRNSDKTSHKVHGTLRGKTVSNKPPGPGTKDLELDAAAQPDDVIEVQCDVHGWERAYAVVQDSPYFAVTDDKGAFEMHGMPQGKYVLEAWHPVLGTKTIDVEVGKGKRGEITARFSYKP